MNRAQIILGESLKTHSKWTDIDPNFAKRIDPEGINLISIAFPHNDGPDWRLLLLFKVIDSDNPVEGTLTVNDKFWAKYVQTVYYDENGILDI